MLGVAAEVTLDTHMLRRIELRLGWLNWQQGGGKGKKPEPVPLPGEKAAKAKPRTEQGADAVERLRNLGLIPATAGSPPSKPADPTPEELRRRGEDLWLVGQERLATET